MAREGADVTIVYLPEEEDDAQDTRKMVESEGRSCHLFGGNLANRETCRKAVEEHMSTLVALTSSAHDILLIVGVVTRN